MTLTKERAFALFEGLQRRHPAARAAFENLPEEEQARAEEFAQEFVDTATIIGAAAQDEIAGLLDANEHEFPENLQSWDHADFEAFLAMVEGSVFRKMHYAATLGFDNTIPMLEAVKAHVFPEGR